MRGGCNAKNHRDVPGLVANLLPPRERPGNIGPKENLAKRVGAAGQDVIALVENNQAA